MIESVLHRASHSTQPNVLSCSMVFRPVASQADATIKGGARAEFGQEHS